MEDERRRRSGPAGGEGCEMMDLSGRGLEELPEHILHMSGLESLYLEGNAISGLSEDFFHQLPNLSWLDLRNNKLSSLPLSIGEHRCLKTLLLEGNPIRKLPVELGNLTSLKALNLRKCPIEFPPDAVVHQGLIAIQAFLRKPNQIKAEHAGLCTHDTGFTTTLHQEAQLIIDEYRRKIDRGILPRKAISEVWKKMNVSKMPLIEKLQLTVRTESSLDFSDEKERQQFKRLKQKLMQDEKKEDSVQSKKVWGAGFLSTTSPILRAKTPNLKAIFPELTASDVFIQTKRKNELKLAALKEHREKQAFIEQRRQDKKTLNDWREKAKLMQEKKETERKQRPTTHATERDTIVKSAPYATDPNYYHTTRSMDWKRPHVHDRIQRVRSEKEMEEARATKNNELQQQIQQHIRLMRDRRQKQKGTPQEEMEAAKRELEIATNLKYALARRKIEDNPFESNYTTVTGEPLSST